MPSQSPALALLGALILMTGQQIQAQNLLQKATELGAHGFVMSAEQGSLNETLTAIDPHTVFVPTDDAFALVPADIKANATLLDSILKYHVVAANISSGDITNDLKQRSLNGKMIRFNKYTVAGNSIVLASGRRVSMVDQAAANGLIHMVDAVLMPPVGDAGTYVSGTGDLSSLLTAVTKAAVTADINADPVTLFAPTNAAFVNANWTTSLTNTELANVLKYHVLNSTKYSAALTDGMTAAATEGNTVFIAVKGAFADDVFINDAKVTGADVTVDNGVVHVIDRVLMRPEGTVIDFLTKENFTTLLEALQFAELTAVVTDTIGLTVFAPTDAAFAALPAGELDALKADKAKMMALLKYHVVPKTAFSPTLSDDENLPTMETGKSISIEIEDNVVEVNDKSTVTKADVPLPNGVLHVVDMVFDVSDSPVSAAVRHIGSGVATTLCALVLAVTMAL